jgi:putative serine/threonine protein kinase
MNQLEELSETSSHCDVQSGVGIPLDKLKAELHGSVLCYPGNDLRTFPTRKAQLKKLGVSEIFFEGDSKVGNLGVAGKGCVSVVLKARMKGMDELAALKCRRIDANRESMQRDYELQKYANSFGVGPKAIAATQDFFAMEFIDGLKIGKWYEKLKTRSSKKFFRRLVRDALTQCLLLDLRALDHGELSNPTKHIMIRRAAKARGLIPKTVIIDYESAGRGRKVSNVTCVAQFFFLRGYKRTKIQKILGFRYRKKKLISLLKEYKNEPEPGKLEKILSYVRC